MAILRLRFADDRCFFCSIGQVAFETLVSAPLLSKEWVFVASSVGFANAVGIYIALRYANAWGFAYDSCVPSIWVFHRVWFSDIVKPQHILFVRLCVGCANTWGFPSRWDFTILRWFERFTGGGEVGRVGLFFGYIANGQ